MRTAFLDITLNKVTVEGKQSLWFLAAVVVVAVCCVLIKRWK
jgi:hypothetical protein